MSTGTFSLIFPATVRGERIASLTIRTPDESDVAWLRHQRGSDFKKSCALFARLCGVKSELIKALDQVDLTRLDVLVEQMFRLQIAELRKLRGA